MMTRRQLRRTEAKEEAKRKAAEKAAEKERRSKTPAEEWFRILKVSRTNKEGVVTRGVHRLGKILGTRRQPVFAGLAGVSRFTGTAIYVFSRRVVIYRLQLVWWKMTIY